MQIEYKKITIDFHEDSEEWFCKEIGKKPSLKAMKAAIDNMSRKDRQLGLKVLKISRPWKRGEQNLVIEEVTVSVFCEPQKVRWGSDQTVVKECWIVDSQKTRSKVDIDDLYPLSARAEIKSYIDQRTAHEEEATRLNQLKEDLPSFDIDSITLAAKEQAPAEAPATKKGAAR